MTHHWIHNLTINTHKSKAPFRSYEKGLSVNFILVKMNLLFKEFSKDSK